MFDPTLAAILYLMELGFDFEKNSAFDLVMAIGDITQLALEDNDIRERMFELFEEKGKEFLCQA